MEHLKHSGTVAISAAAIAFVAVLATLGTPGGILQWLPESAVDLGDAVFKVMGSNHSSEQDIPDKNGNPKAEQQTPEQNGNPLGAMQAIVIHTSSKGTNVEEGVSYEAPTTVASFKAQMADKFGTSPAGLCILSKGGSLELEDEKTMGDYDSKDSNNLFRDVFTLVAWGIGSSSPDEFKLKIKFHGLCIEEAVKASQTVDEVKKQIISFTKEASGFLQAAKQDTADGIEIFFAGKCLEDAKTLADYQIGPDSMIFAYRQYDAGELQTVMPKSVLIAAFPSEFNDGTYIQKPGNDTAFAFA